MTLSVIPQTQPVGLPGYYYSDSQIFAQELKTIWSRSWQWVGRQEDLQKPGDYLTCLIGEEPIVVIRTEEGKLQALHNVCPHRGAPLLDGQGNCSALICPYHGWNFDIEGQLRAITQPHLFPDLDKSTIQLHKARVDTWGGFIFVNPDPVGESLMDYLATIPDHFRETNLPWEELREVLRWTYDVPSNWKLIVENFIEEYHLPYVHPQTLSMMDKQHIRTTPTGSHIKYHVTFVDPSRKETSVWEKWDRSWDADSISYQAQVFPNLLILAEKDNVSFWRLRPINPGRTIVEMFFYQTPAQAEETPLVGNFRSCWEQLMEEDLAICRSIQQAVNSRAYKVTQLAGKSEQAIADFNKVYLAAMSTCKKG